MSQASRKPRSQFNCPFCNSKLICRTSWRAHTLLRQELYTCSNPFCNAGIGGHTELTHLINPSGLADAPSCSLPETSHYARRMAQRAHDTQSAENDAPADHARSIACATGTADA
ncbi:ogr/Delta-like zinc finger family protein [Pseudomonas mangiferae]|uniref:Zinc finger Ogr/Delta-type domain-containing protein n=1 Tax=Pseudomonas mangiferae TaxID=2593654 RepID=A0A553H0M2_9PSED|nr:hypothetical protein FM069_09365 [Pseudomonas mangiferae]